ncbi:MAG: SufE family protein [Anaerolineales bacterium]|jgi:cysteine desulfuration protein SufE
MNDIKHTIPPHLREIIEDFEISVGREKLELLLDYSQRMPPLPENLAQDHEHMDQVQECMTPVFVTADAQNGQMHFYFDVPAESPTVRGYAALLAEGVDGISPEEVLAIPADFYLQMGLDKVLTHQRLNGITAILAHMKRLALETMNA